MSCIAIIGAGAIGKTVAAHLHGHSLWLGSRTPIETFEVETPDGILRPSFTPVLSPQHVPPMDWVFLCTKAYQTANAQGWLEASCRPPTRLAVLQNGVEHKERVRPFLRETPVVPVIVSWVARRLQAGPIVQQGRMQLVVPVAQLSQPDANK